MAENKNSVERELGKCPESDRAIWLKDGRFGPYVQREKREGSKMKPKNAALLKGTDPASVTLEMALKLLALPRLLGEHPVLNQHIEAHNGRYGPYLKCGSETRKLPSDISPVDVTFEQAILLFAQPKKKSKKPAERKKPVKMLGESPVTGESVTVLVGKFGLYVTDGDTNATIPKEFAADGITFEHALELLDKKRKSE